MVRVVIDADHPWFAHHVVRGRLVMPGVAWIHVVMQVVAQVRPDCEVYGVVDAAWLRPVVANSRIELFVDIDDHDVEDKLYYTIDNGGQRCGMGELLLEPVRTDPSVSPLVQSGQGFAPLTILTRKQLYDEFAAMGIEYGPYFRRIAYVQRRGKTSFAVLNGRDFALEQVNLMDCAFQGGLAIAIGEHRESLMPFSLGRLIFHQQPIYPLEDAFVLTRKHSPFRTSCTVFNDDFEPLVSVADLGVKPAQ